MCDPSGTSMEGVDSIDSACPSLSSDAASPLPCWTSHRTKPQPTSPGRAHHALAAWPAWTRRIFHTHSMHEDSLQLPAAPAALKTALQDGTRCNHTACLPVSRLALENSRNRRLLSGSLSGASSAMPDSDGDISLQTAGAQNQFDEMIEAATLG